MMRKTFLTSALDMPEIMSYIYNKSWKLQFSASSSIIIIEDFYLQTFLHSLFDYAIYNKSAKKHVYSCYFSIAHSKFLPEHATLYCIFFKILLCNLKLSIVESYLFNVCMYNDYKNHRIDKRGTL